MMMMILKAFVVFIYPRDFSFVHLTRSLSEQKSFDARFFLFSSRESFFVCRFKNKQSHRIDFRKRRKVISSRHVLYTSIP